MPEMAPTLSADRLAKFTTAMQRVYRFPTLSSSSFTPEPWTPPPTSAGQYHHYLTLWTFALGRLAAAWRREAGGQAEAEAEATRWEGLALRLMEAVHPAFVYDREKERPRMYWNASTGLERPLVMSEGNLDPVGGLVVCKVLRESEGNAHVLERETRGYEKIVATKWKNYVSDDPLDLGMTLWTAHQYAGKEEWATGLVERAKRDLKKLINSGYFSTGVRRRLASREFGTVLGIRCALAHDPGWEEAAEKIVKIWEDAGVAPDPEENTSADLMPITLVMYAAAVEPGAFKRGWLESS
ncbi:uncharacterized protein LTHEOB_8986 [Neofusicoccum parvum]|nr:uncharacterized protein LTHEOB_8986 [Neofusicoccum parvum]